MRAEKTELTRRIAVSLLIAVYSGCLFLFSQRISPGHSDFSIVWYGARTLIDGGNPYALIGPGRTIPLEWPLHYPATTLIAAIPFSVLSESAATLVFVTGSAFLVAYGALRDNVNRIWIFASAAFVVNAKSGQWSALMASVYFLPSAAVFLCLKPSDGLAVACGTDRRSLVIAFLGAIVLGVISLIVFPAWPREWLRAITGTWEFVSPVMRMGGFVLLLASLRLKSREGRFLLALSLVPQVQSWYAGFLPLLVAQTKRENQVLSLVSSLGYVLMIPLALTSPTREISSATIGRLMVAFCYLPALIVVLKRPNGSVSEQREERQ